MAVGTFEGGTVGSVPVRKTAQDMRTTLSQSVASGKMEPSVLSEPVVLETPAVGPLVLVEAVPARVVAHLPERAAVQY